MNYCVDGPARVSRGWGPERQIAVRARCADARVETTALRRADGSYRIFVATPLRRAAGAGEGDSIALELERIPELSEPDVPSDLQRALAQSKDDRDAWRALTLRQRRDFARYLGEARGVETRRRRLSDGLERIRRKSRPGK
jgi:hypothetical protein